MPTAPPLVLDMATSGAFRLTDPDTKALVASAWLAEVAATPGLYAAANENNPGHTQPVLTVDVPGALPLRIGARPMGAGRNGPLFRYGWRGSIHATGWILYVTLSMVAMLRGRSRIPSAKEPNYLVTEGEWLALVHAFGLDGRVVDEHDSGDTERREQLGRIKHYLFVAVTLIAFGVAIYLHFGK